MNLLIDVIVGAFIIEWYSNFIILLVFIIDGIVERLLRPSNIYWNYASKRAQKF